MGAAPEGGPRLLQARVSNAQIALLVAGVLLCRVLWVQACPIYDDAFITYRYARNMAAGKGLIFNPGAEWEPVLGTTSPGYAVVLAALGRLGAGIVPASLAFNFVGDAISVLILVLLLGRRLVPAVVAAAGFAAMPDLGRISSGGMEAPLCAALALGACLARERNRPVLAGLVAALACAVRPEAVLLVLALGCSYLREPRRLARFAVPVIAFGCAYAGALTLVYGSPIPQSVKAKAAQHADRVQLGRIDDILQLAFFPIKYMLVLLPCVALGMLRSLKRAGGQRLFSIVALAIVCAYLAVRPKTWGWYYYVPLTAWALWFGLGVEALVERFAPGLASARAARFAAPASMLACAASVAIAASVRPDLVTERVYGEMARWIEEDDIVERGASVMASDIGAIGWFADTRILDSMGLVWPEAVSYPNQLELIRSTGPEYVVMVAIQPRIAPFVSDPELGKAYAPIRRINARGGHYLYPPPEKLPGGWVQDYIVYRRVDFE